MDNIASKTSRPREPWNKGKLVGQKAPFRAIHRSDLPPAAIPSLSRRSWIRSGAIRDPVPCTRWIAGRSPQ